MANYQILKADIDEKIYENAQQKITGENLNSVLNAMVATLGAEYQFAGVATIDTNPETSDAKVFYIANGKGTYTNFGGINVTEDDVVVLYWDTAWHKVATGIASQAKLSELEKTTSIFSLVGKGLSGQYPAALTYKSYPCRKGHRYLIQINNLENWSVSELESFPNYSVFVIEEIANGVTTLLENIHIDQLSSIKGQYSVFVESNSFLNIGIRADEGNTIYFSILDISQFDNVVKISTGKNLVLPTYFKVGYRFDDIGQLIGSPSGAYTPNFIPIHPNKEYCLSAIDYIGEDPFYCCFYDDALRFISSVSTTYTKAKTFTSPANAAFIRLSVYVSALDDELMLEEGNSRTDYEEYNPIMGYLGGVVSSINSKVDIKIGKNILDKSWLSAPGRYLSDGSINDNAISKLTERYIEVDGSTDYVLSATSQMGESTYYIIYYDANKEFISSQEIGGVTSRAFTTPENCAYIRFGIYASVIENDVMLEKGQSRTTYEEYNPIGGYGISTFLQKTTEIKTRLSLIDGNAITENISIGEWDAGQRYLVNPIKAGAIIDSIMGIPNGGKLLFRQTLDGGYISVRDNDGASIDVITNQTAFPLQVISDINILRGNANMDLSIVSHNYAELQRINDSLKTIDEQINGVYKSVDGSFVVNAPSHSSENDLILLGQSIPVGMVVTARVVQGTAITTKPNTLGFALYNGEEILSGIWGQTLGDIISLPSDVVYDRVGVYIEGVSQHGTFICEFKIPQTAGIIESKQDKLESGVNIKTINGESILGEGDISVNGDFIPSYFETNVTNAISSAKANLSEIDSNGVSFIFISDTHWESNSKHSPALIGKVTRELPVKDVIFGGDAFNGGASDAMIELLRDFGSKMNRNSPIFMSCFGNHDKNLNDGGVGFAADEFYTFVQKYGDEYISYGKRGYFFKDNELAQTRYIFLDTNSSDGGRVGTAEEQLEWLANCVTSAPNGWHFVVFMHIYYYEDTDPEEDRVIGFIADVVSYLDSAKLGGKMIEAIFAGHIHRDFNTTTPQGIPVVMIDCDARQTQSGLPQTIGTIGEQAFDIVTINYSAKSIKCVRVGRGNNRVINY